jgi:hypothetical protein
MVKKLDIKNLHKVIHSEYHRGRFVCTNALETDTNFRFQFRDMEALSARYIWVEVTKFGHFNQIEGNWEYRLNYPNCPTHVITAKWFEKEANVRFTFEEALKESL